MTQLTKFVIKVDLFARKGENFVPGLVPLDCSLIEKCAENGIRTANSFVFATTFIFALLQLSYTFHKLYIMKS